MAKLKSEIEVRCPCCDAVLVVDTNLGRVVSHQEPERGHKPELSDAQRTRLSEVLTRIYGHPVAVQLHVDPDLIGGLSITVGDEVIDGSIASRLAAAESQLPD